MMNQDSVPKYCTEPQECDDAFDLDELLQNTQNLTRLAKPCTQLLQAIDRIRRWEPWSICLVVLGVSNCACIMLESFYIVFSLLALSTLAGVGYTHRQTNILAKVFPSPDCDPPRVMTDSTPSTDSQRDLVQSEILEEFKYLLCCMNSFTRVLTKSLIHFYSVVKWENFHYSLRCYILLMLLTILLHVIPMRWSFTLLTNVFLLHYPCHQYFLVINNMRGSVARRQFSNDTTISTDFDSDTDSNLACPAIFTDSQRYVQRCIAEEAGQQKGVLFDGTEENEAGEKSEGGTSSDDAIEMRLGTPLPVSGVNGKVKRPGMVGKILKTVKNQTSSGSCAGCNVNFMTILKRRRLCSHCGNHFCIRCCSYKVTRSMFGATAPAAQTETVSVCFYCFNYLNKIYRSRGGSKTSLNSLAGSAGGGRQNGNGSNSRRSKSEGQAMLYDSIKDKSQ